jgi:L-threonate 2-dehydrogenase
MAAIGIVSAGGMGAGIGRCLADHGHRVLTVLDGRSDASRRRAEAAGMQAADWEAMARVDIFLSVVPPGEAMAVARRMAGLISRAGTRPLYADLNAVSPATAEAVAEVIMAAGAEFADASIIGLPPVPGGAQPVIHTSGPGAAAFAVLRRDGLDIRAMDAPVGAASALKICQAGLVKGYIGLAAMVVRAADRYGIAAPLRAEMDRLRPELMTFLGPANDRMFDKAYRFVGEMDEIADFLAEDPGAVRLFGVLREVFEGLAADRAGANGEIATLARFYGLTPPPAPSRT